MVGGFGGHLDSHQDIDEDTLGTHWGHAGDVLIGWTWGLFKCPEFTGRRKTVGGVTPFTVNVPFQSHQQPRGYDWTTWQQGWPPTVGSSVLRVSRSPQLHRSPALPLLSLSRGIPAFLCRSVPLIQELNHRKENPRMERRARGGLCSGSELRSHPRSGGEAMLVVWWG